MTTVARRGQASFSCWPGLKVELAERSDVWDRYVDSVRPERLYYRWVWREVIEHSFGHRPYYLAAAAGGVIRGVLPLVFVESRLFGNSLVSIPFFSYGGVLADDLEASRALLASAVELGRELNVHHIELRSSEDMPPSTSLPCEWVRRSHKVTMEVELPRTVDDYWQRLSPGRRKRIRYLLRHQLRTEWGGIESLPVFYKIFATNMRNLGTPVYAYEFFEQQLSRLPNSIRILILRDANKAVATAFLTAHGETLELPWAASLPESRKKEAPTLLYWGLIERAIKEGFRRVDLGRCSPGSGNYEFKRHWNPVEKPLHWYQWTRPGSSTRTPSSDNPKFVLATAIWKRLPLWLANLLGPKLIRAIP